MLRTMKSQRLKLLISGAVVLALSWRIYWMIYVSNKPTSQEKALQYSNLAFKLSQNDGEVKKKLQQKKEQETSNAERKIQLAEKFDRMKVNREYGRNKDNAEEEQRNAAKLVPVRGGTGIGNREETNLKGLPSRKEAVDKARNEKRKEIENGYYALIHSGTASKVHGSIYQKINPMPSDVSAENYILQSKQLPQDKRFYPSIGNGNLGTVIHSDKVFVNGVYNGFRKHSHRAVIPSTCAVNITETEPPTKFSRMYMLNLGSGMYTEESRSEQYKLTQRIYAHRKMSNLLVVEVDLVRKTPAPLTLKVSLNRWTVSEDITFMKLESDLSAVSYKFGRISSPETEDSRYTEVHIYYDHVPNTLTAPDDALKVKWVFLTSIGITKKEAKDAYMKGIELLREQDNLFTSHVQAWSELWAEGAIHIKGNNALSQATYASQYYILSSIPWKQRLSLPFTGLSPTGIAAGEFEKGRILWDQEIWMYPPLLLFYPNVAEILLSTRKRTADQARKNAERYKSKGLQFPSESTVSGMELSFDEKAAQYRKHISGDISWAIMQYVYATNNTSFLRQNGYNDILTGIADFWVSQLKYSKTKIGHEILNAIPPDEDAQIVNNSVYTNSVAKISLEAIEEVTRRYGNTNTRYREFADKLYIPLDEKVGYHPEYDRYHGQPIKQADVILLGYPLNVKMSNTVRKKDLEVYEKVVQKDCPAMTWSMYSICHLDSRNQEKGNQLFRKQFQYINGNFKVWSEYPEGKGAVNFLSGMGGFLQNIIAGYGGFRLYPHKLDFNLALPPQATEVTFLNIDYLGCGLDFRLDSDKHLTVELKRQPIEVSKLMVYVYSTQAIYTLNLNSKVPLPFTKAAVYTDKTAIPVDR